MPPKKKVIAKGAEKSVVETEKKIENATTESHPIEKNADLIASQLSKNEKEELTKAETPILIHAETKKDKEIEANKTKVQTKASEQKIQLNNECSLTQEELIKQRIKKFGLAKENIENGIREITNQQKQKKEREISILIKNLSEEQKNVILLRTIKFGLSPSDVKDLIEKKEKTKVQRHHSRSHSHKRFFKRFQNRDKYYNNFKKGTEMIHHSSKNHAKNQYNDRSRSRDDFKTKKNNKKQSRLKRHHN